MSEDLRQTASPLPDAGRAQDHHERIIEVMSDPASESSNGREFLALHQLLFEKSSFERPEM